MSQIEPMPEQLLNALRELIRQGRQRVLQAVDTVQVQTYWQVGRHIVEFEQGGQARAEYGKRLLPQLAEALTRDFGKGFDASNLRNMRLFFQAFPNCDALRHELRWTHYRLLLRVDDATARPDVGQLRRKAQPHPALAQLAVAHLTNRLAKNHNGTITVLEVSMPATITLKNIPDELYNRLKEVASIHHRSINGEVIACLEQMLLPERVSAKERIAKARQLRAGLEPGKFYAQDIAEAIRQGRP